MSDTPMTSSDLPAYPWLEVANPHARLGHVRHALFDFDGTISVIRRGWEAIMIPLMVEMICEGHAVPAGLEDEVASFVDRSTGVLTIEQMRWLEDTVRRYGLAQQPMPAAAYKKIYNERLLKPVRVRLAEMEGAGDPGAAADTLTIAGVRAFLQGLHDRQVTLYLASGSDHIYVQEEAAALGVSALFGEHIYGARDDTEDYSKERIIQAIIRDHDLHGEELLVVGDGPVEIRNAKAQDALALGIAANEEQRQGLDPRKRQRLLAAGADFIVTDFLAVRGPARNVHRALRRCPPRHTRSKPLEFAQRKPSNSRIGAMPITIALLRGINVGGNKKIAMSDLRALLETLGLTQVHTILQSGNVAFQSATADRAALRGQLEAGIEQRFGFHSDILLRTLSEFEDVVSRNPLPADLADPSKRVVMFLSDSPTPDAISALLDSYSGPETIRVVGSEAYLYYPDGLGRSKLNNVLLERKLKVSGTVRNWNTILKLLDLAGQLEEA